MAVKFIKYHINELLGAIFNEYFKKKHCCCAPNLKSCDKESQKLVKNHLISFYLIKSSIFVLVLKF